MVLRLTDSQVVLLDWDNRRCLKTGKGWREYEVSAEEVREVRDIADTMSWGSDFVSAAKALLRKLDKMETSRGSI